MRRLRLFDEVERLLALLLQARGQFVRKESKHVLLEELEMLERKQSVRRWQLVQLPKDVVKVEPD
jgi:hypothetical protein